MTPREELESLRRLAELESKERGAQPKATLRDKWQSSLPMRVIQGMRDPIDAGAQLVPHALEAVTSVGGAFPNRVSGFFGDEAKRVDQMNRESEGQYQQARQATGNQGADLARIAGNVVSPVNAAIASRLPIAAAASVPRLVAQGAGVGAIGGALTPVNREEGESFWGAKGAQTVLGGATGGVLTPVLAKVGGAVANRVNALVARARPEQTAARAAQQTDELIAQAMRDIGAAVDDLPQQQMAALRQQVAEALRNGRQLDAAALMRRSDFEALGMEPLLGQITRNATQFARERNLRGVAGVGEPIQTRLDNQNQRLQQLVAQLRGDAHEPYQAGNTIINALQGVDDRLNSNVNAAYQGARDSAGRYAPINVRQFSEAANNALDEGMLGHFLPPNVRNLLNDVSGGRIPLNVNTMVQLDQVLATAQRTGDRAAARAVGVVRDALHAAPLEGQAGTLPARLEQGTHGQAARDAFNTARGMARERFQMHDAIPSLRAVANGDASPDNFVRRFVVGGNTDEVQRLAQLLQTNSPEAFQEARAQIGAVISRAAFGENVAADKIASPERLAKALRDIGTDKLRAFYSPREIDQMRRISRVSAYANSTPSSAPVNTSNTAGAVMSLLGRVPGVPSGVAIANAMRTAVGNQRAAASAMNAQVPATRAPLTPQQIEMMSRALSIGAAGAGGAAAIR